MGVLIETETEWAFITPAGHRSVFSIRPGSSDWNTCNSCSGEHDEYHLPSGLSGWALDVGAHIGAATIPLLLDNPDLHVVAIEALPENFALLTENLARNGVADRCLAFHAAASDSTRPVQIGYGPRSGENQHSEFIGSANGPTAATDFASPDGITLAAVLDAQGRGAEADFAWMKIDCEGCEYPFLSSSLVSRIAFITGEHHFGYERVKALLEATHEVTMLGGTEGFGHFEAVRRG